MTKLGRSLIKSAGKGRAFATRRRAIRIRFVNIEPWRPAFPPAVKAYIKMLRAGEQLPPIEVIRQPGHRWRIGDALVPIPDELQRSKIAFGFVLASPLENKNKVSGPGTDPENRI